MKQYQGKIIAVAVIVGVLAGAFFWGGNHPGRDAAHRADVPANMAPAATADTPGAPGNANEPAAAAPGQPAPADTAAPGSGSDRSLTADEKLALAAALAGGESSAGVDEGSSEYSAQRGMVIDEATGKDQYLTDPVPAGKPVPVEPEDAAVRDAAYTCILSVRCDTILQNIKWLDPEKVELVPEDGVILPSAPVTFYGGESVFNVLLREMKKNKIHMEFVNVSMYNSAYIEGINNLYEFDCGELSGWMYKVNDWFPNYGCSRYRLQDGDVVEWVYTCDLGRDVGGYYAIGGQ